MLTKREKIYLAFLIRREQNFRNNTKNARYCNFVLMTEIMLQVFLLR